MTPHISAKKGEISKIVIMPGCPLRAKWIAENYLENSVLVSEVRNMLAYTGTYKSVQITVMGSGMGIGSAGIYTWELFAKQFYDADLVIRVGSCGSLSRDVVVNGLFLVESSYSENIYPSVAGLKMDDCSVMHSSPEAVNLVKEVNKTVGLDLLHGRAYNTDAFYDARPIEHVVKKSGGAQVVDMESFVLFANAALHKKEALCLLTCSDCLIKKSIKLTPEERQTTLGKMINLALETAVQYSKNKK